MFESEAEKILRRVADNSPEFQKSVADYAARKENSCGILVGKIAKIDTRLDTVVTERQNLDKRLNFLLADDDPEMAQSFRAEYKRQFSAINDEERGLESKKNQLQLLLKHLKETQDASESGWLEHTNKALGYICKKDLVSLRSAYRQIFEKIVVRRLDEARVRLQFVFKHPSSSSYMGEVGCCVSEWS